MNFEETGEFAKDFKKLFKKYRSLEEDLKMFQKNVIYIDITCNRKFAVLHKNENLIVIKARFFCKYLKGKTLRIVYAYYEMEKKIVFIQLFFKGDKEKEDSGRIKKYLTGK